jgi:colanic acid biosynthesis glycosyl transferase WcaI
MTDLLQIDSRQAVNSASPRSSGASAGARKSEAMKILVYGLNYAPELTGIGKYTAELCEWLAQQGHTVKVVAGHPYYPDWKVTDTYDNRKYQKEWRHGVEIVHCPLFVPSLPTGRARIISHISFSLMSALKAISVARRFRPDVLFCVTPSFFITPGAIVAARLGRTPRWLHVQDFEIDSAFELGILTGSLLRRTAAAFESSILKRFDRVSTISPRMIDQLVRKGVRRADTVEFRNWVDTSAIRPADRMTTYRRQMGLSADHMVALYSGSIAAKQGIENLVPAARDVFAINPRVVFVFCGNGAMRGQLVESAASLPNARFLDLQPDHCMSELLATADIHLIPQRPQVADLMLPSKLAPILASGRPAVVMADPGTQLATEIKDAGLAVPPGDGVALVQAILKLAGDPELRASMGRNGRELACARWDKEAILREFEQQLMALVTQGTHAYG